MFRMLLLLLIAVAAAVSPPTVSVREAQYVADCEKQGDFSPYLGKFVRLDKVFVTSASAFRFTVSDSAAVAAWSSVAVSVPRLTPDLVAEGMRVSLTGRVSEYGAETVLTDVGELIVHAELKTATIVPAALTTAELAATGSCAEERWEGALVRVDGARILSDADGAGTMLIDDGSGTAAANAAFLWPTDAAPSLGAELRNQWADATTDDSDDAWAARSLKGATLESLVGVVVFVAPLYEIVARFPGDAVAGGAPAGADNEKVAISAIQDVSSRRARKPNAFDEPLRDFSFLASGNIRGAFKPAGP